MPLPILAGQVGLGVYAALLGVGGLMGYVNAGSRPSLVAGLASAVIAALALAMTFVGRFGFWIGLVLGVAMVVVFGIRYRKTGKFMPAGLLIAASLVICGLMPWALANLG